MKKALVEVKPIEEADLEFVRQLRNRLRCWFFDSRPVSAEQQTEWHACLKEQAGVTFYVIWLDGHPVGAVSLRETSDGVEIGNLMLDQAVQGQGVMQQACRVLLVPRRRYFARVKPNNRRSLRLLARLGFVPAYVAVERNP